MSYKHKLIIYFSALFFIFASILIGLQWNYDRNLKKRMFENRLNTYADLISDLNIDNILYDNLLHKGFPKELRISIINSVGDVIFESEPDIHSQSNHLDRPEIAQAIISGIGSHIRMSDTIHKQFYYYAKQYPNFIVRVAMPYNETTKLLLSPDSLVIFLMLLFVGIGLLGIMLISNKLSESIENLKTFVESAERGLVDYDYIHFPNNELGVLGEKIVNVYRKAEERRVDLETEKKNKKIYKQQMSNNITHELRTPVTAIQGYLETLERNPNIETDKRKHFINRALIQSYRLSELIRDVALITKMEEASSKITRQKVLLTDIVEEVKSDLATLASEKDVEFINRIPSDLLIEGNPSLLYSIICNLYENSIKYASPCKCMLEIVAPLDSTIRTNCSKRTDDLSTNNSLITLRYSNNCNSLNKEHLSRIFERFYRSDVGRTRKDGGTGLGLSIVKNAVNLHGGTIKAEILRNVEKKKDARQDAKEQESEYLTFTFTLPISTS